MNYGKVYKSMYTGSMAGAGIKVYAVWTWIIANVADFKNGFCEIHPVHVANQLGGITVPEVEDVLAFLTSPDEHSRTPEEDGRRLTHLGGFAYQVVNFVKYDIGAAQAERRAYLNEAKRRSRERAKVGLEPHDMSTH